MKLSASADIYISESGISHAGRGVFASKNIKKDDVIEVCPVIVLREEETPDLKKTQLNNYYFRWGKDMKNHHIAAICLGYGSLYNHSYSPNATYHKLIDKHCIEFVAIKDIAINEEITVNYNNGNPNDRSKLWIESIPPAE